MVAIHFYIPPKLDESILYTATKIGVGQEDPRTP